ncbi:MAG: hypothetical protein JSV44_11710 [Candidatus Zixiibacteriota bacterium]|nr:MAG: hypothetical protein JSV44_11710 [candidate division Zixibacteria bacterium]
MIIKSFTANTAAAALKLIREELGSEAVILKTRLCCSGDEDPIGKQVEVTACIDDAAARKPLVKRPAIGGEEQPEIIRTDRQPLAPRKNPGVSRPGPAVKLDKTLNLTLNPYRAPIGVDDLDRRLQPIFLEFIDADLPIDIARQYIRELQQALLPGDDPYRAARELIRRDLAANIAVNVHFKPGMKVVFAGPGGSGKTSALAKLAAHLIADKKLEIRLVSMNDKRITACEEIGGYADSPEVPLEITGKITGGANRDLVQLIDTPSIALGPDCTSKSSEIVNAVNADIVFLTFSVCARTSDLIDAANIFKALRPTYLVASRLDETDRWGSLVAMTKCLDTPLAYVTSEPGSTGSLRPPEPALIAGRILKAEGIVYE